MRSQAIAMILGAIILSLCRAAIASQEAVPFKTAASPPRHPWATSTTPVVLQFDDGMPPQLEIVRLARSDEDRGWRLVETVRTMIRDGRATVTGPIGVETLLLIRASDHPGYLLDGPFRWPVKPSTYLVRTTWRKTVRGSFAGPRGPLEWVAADDRPFPALTCEWAEGTTWECIGVPLNAVGIVLMTASGEVDCGIPSSVVSPSGVDTARTSKTMWGRLIVVSKGGSPPAGAIRMLARRWNMPPGRPASIRADVRPDTRVHVTTISDGVAWLSGGDAPQGEAWLEVGASARATERVDMREVSGAPPDMPLRVQLQPAASLSGRVRSAAGEAANGAVLSLFRFADDPLDRAKASELRLPVGETTADANGNFQFEDLSIEPYEIVAMHAVLGRGLRRVVPDGREIEIVLQSSGRATGRVVRDGLAAAGVRVAVLPELAQFAGAADMTEVRGGEATTDRQGRFVVSLPFRGSSELRVGQREGPVTRVPLGPAGDDDAVINVGDVELAEGVSITFVLEGGGSCDILATGPIGRAGMSVVRSARIGPALSQATVPEPGRWHVAAACGSRERAVRPGWVDLSPGARDVTVRLTWQEPPFAP